MAGSGVAVSVAVGSNVGVAVTVGVGDGGSGVGLGTIVVVGGEVGEGGKAVGDGAGVAAGAQAERSRAAKRIGEASRVKRMPVMALRQRQSRQVGMAFFLLKGCGGIVNYLVNTKEDFPSPQDWIITCPKFESSHFFICKKPQVFCI